MQNKVIKRCVLVKSNHDFSPPVRLKGQSYPDVYQIGNYS